MSKDAKTIREQLAQPFAPEDLEWRVQVATKDKTRGLAVPYVTNRAIQERLDDVVGPDCWYNEYRPWHANGEKEAQICGITILFDGKPITKWDGAEDSDIEPIKGGLSDSMKRAAVQWGIGRVLYKMDTVWVDVEPQGRSVAIKSSERTKLDKAYTDTLARLGLTHAKATGLQSQLTPKQDASSQQTPPAAAEQKQPQAAQAQVPDNVTQMPRPQTPQWEYVVTNVNIQRGMSQSSTSLMLKDATGKTVKAFAKGTPEDLVPGAQLCNVTLSVKQQNSVAFYLLEHYEIVGNQAQAA